MEKTKLIKYAVIGIGIAVLVIVGKPAFSVLFGGTFIVLFLAPLVILATSMSTSKKLNELIDNYKSTKELHYVAQVSNYIIAKKYKGPVDFKFFGKMKDFYALVEQDPNATAEMIEQLKSALIVYNIKVEPEIDETLLETI